MTLALYGKSRKRRAWLLAAAVLAVVAAVGGGTYLNAGTASATTPGTVQFHKYLPGNGGQPWQNEASHAFTFNVYGDANLTQLLGSGTQLGSGVTVPQGDIWITEAAQTGYTTAGFYIPDGDGTSGNDKCNQKAADGTDFATREANGSLKVSASLWNTKGNGTGILHICAYNDPAPTTGTVIVNKVVSGTGASATDTFAGDLKLAGSVVTDGHITDLSANTPHTFSNQALGSYTFVETNPGTYTLQGYSAGTLGVNGAPVCPDSANPNFSGVTLDAQHTTAVICVYNNLQAQTLTQSVEFAKVICPSYSLVPANDSPTSIDQTGGHGGDLATGHVTKPVSLYIPDGCTLGGEGWQFNTYSGWNGNTTPAGELPFGPLGGPYTTDGSGTTTVTLSAAELSAALSGNGLWVTETLRPGVASFGALRCYNDVLNGDNLERIDLKNAGTTGVMCVAYNVQPTRTVKVTKVVAGSGAPTGLTFSGTITGSTTSLSWQTTDAGSVTESSVASEALTVTETSAQGTSWSFGGYAVVAGLTTDCSSVTYSGADAQATGISVPATGDQTVCVKNVYTAPPKQQVTFIKAICPSFGVIPANQPYNGGYGTNDMPAGLDQTDLGLAAPAEGAPVTLANIPASCTRAAGWTFNLTDSGGPSLGSVTTTANGAADGGAGITVTLTEGQLAAALKPWYNGSIFQGLSVSEVKQEGYGFGELKCYEDHRNIDNNDFINITTPGTSGVYCIAYNVPANRNMTVGKIVDNVPADGTLFAVSVDGTPKGDISASGTTVATQVDGNSHTVVEGDVSGYSHVGWFVLSSGVCTGYSQGDIVASGSGATASVPSGTGDVTICFTNHSEKTIKVHITKYLDGAPATAGSANNYAFPMTSTWSASNIGAGTGNYPLSPSGFGGAGAYAADTSPMTVGASYSTSEQLATTCANGAPYKLVGYATSATGFPTDPNAASTTTPSFTNLQSDQYVTVFNASCTGTLHLTKVTQGASDPHGAQFSGTVDNSNSLAWGPLSSGETSATLTVLAGSHTIQEAAASADPTLWTPAGLAYANGQSHNCPPNPDSGLTSVQVDGGTDVYVCVYNVRRAADSVDGTIKVIKVVTGSNLDNNQKFQVQAGTQTDTLTNGGSTTFTFTFSSDHPTTDVTPVEESSIPAGYALLGYRIYQGGVLSCDPPDNSLVQSVGTLTISADHPAYTVCIYNQPQGTITINKVVSPSTDPGRFDLEIDGATKANNVGNGGSTGAVTVVAGSHTVSEAASNPGTNLGSYTSTLYCSTSTNQIGATSGTVTVAAGAKVVCTFTNTRYTPPQFPPCFGASCGVPQIVVTPTATQPSATGTATATSTKVPVTVTQAPATVTGTPPIEITLGERTPGPGASGITPAAPSTGSGRAGNGNGNSRLLMALLGIFALSGGLAILSLGRRMSSRS